MANHIHLSRRGLLRGAAGLGAVGVAGVIGIEALTSSASGAPENTASSAPTEPIVAHVKDLSTGEVDLFVGTRRVRLRDPQLAARLAQAAR